MLKIYFHEPSDTLGISQEGWNYVVLVKFVPFVKRGYSQRLVVDYNDPIDYVEHPVAEPMTPDWILIGDL